MKALTICQPYAFLICLPATDPRHKRIENRTWETRYRGPLLIHAGKSRTWMDSYRNIDPHEAANLVFGAIVGVANLYDCVEIGSMHKYTLLSQSVHCEGPWCWLVDDVRAFRKPIPCSGSQGIWEYRGELPEVQA